MNSLQYISTTFRGRDPDDNTLPENDPTKEIIGTELVTTDPNATTDPNPTPEAIVTDLQPEIKEEKQEQPEPVILVKQKLITKVSNAVLFLPRVLIYLPIYYSISSIVYMFKNWYQFIKYHISRIDFRDDSEYADTSMDDSPPSTEEDEAYEESFKSTPVQKPKQKHQTKSPSSKYAPKSTISTILEEESIEFDPDFHEDDDYYKSPADVNPVENSNSKAATCSETTVTAETNKEKEKPETDTTDNKNTTSHNTSKMTKPKVSKLNYKLLQAVSSTQSLSTASTDEEVKPASVTQKSKQATSNTSTSTTTTKRRKKKKYIFPKLLFDFDILNPPNLPRKTLVLDLDETLIHSLSRYNSSSLNKSKGKSIEVKVHGSVPTLYHIYKRPYVEEFLAIVYEWFDLVCFTASIKEYADPVIDYLEQQTLSNDEMKKAMKRLKLETQPNKIFNKRYYRDSCTFVQGKGYLKDLAVVLNNQPRPRSNSKTKSRSSSISSNISNMTSSMDTKSQFDYSKIVIIDNSPISFSPNKGNGLMIEGWINDPDDLELMNLLPLLHSLRFVSDVRCLLGLTEGQRAFTYS